MKIPRPINAVKLFCMFEVGRRILQAEDFVTIRSKDKTFFFYRVLLWNRNGKNVKGGWMFL